MNSLCCQQLVVCVSFRMLHLILLNKDAFINMHVLYSVING